MCMTTGSSTLILSKDDGEHKFDVRCDALDSLVDVYT